MASHTIRNMFHNFKFTKSVAEILNAIEKKATEVSFKIKEREARISKLRESYEISDTDMISLLSQAASASKNNEHTMSYALTSNRPMSGAPAQMGEGVRNIPAGVVTNLLTERSLIEEEKKSVDRLDLISRNLRTIPDWPSGTGTRTLDSFELSFEELEYLGF